MLEVFSMKPIHALLISLFLCFTSVAQDNRALLIGIGNYPAEYGWNKIHGQNDVNIIIAATCCTCSR